MAKLKYVVDLIQQIHDEEEALARKRELLDSAWQELLAEGRLIALDAPHALPFGLGTVGSSDLRLPHAGSD